jgi:hypothetical protein
MSQQIKFLLDGKEYELVEVIPNGLCFPGSVYVAACSAHGMVMGDTDIQNFVENELVNLVTNGIINTLLPGPKSTYTDTPKYLEFIELFSGSDEFLDRSGTDLSSFTGLNTLMEKYLAKHRENETMFKKIDEEASFDGTFRLIMENELFLKMEKLYKIYIGSLDKVNPRTGQYTYEDPEVGPGQALADRFGINIHIYQVQSGSLVKYGQEYLCRQPTDKYVRVVNTGHLHYKALIPYVETRQRTKVSTDPVDQLQEFGFSLEDATDALHKYSDVGEAAAYLFQVAEGNPGVPGLKVATKMLGKKNPRKKPQDRKMDVLDLTNESDFSSQTKGRGREEETTFQTDEGSSKRFVLDFDSAIAQIMSNPEHSEWNPEKIGDNLDKLHKMGYTIEQSIFALDAAKENDVNSAVEILLSSGGKRRSLKRKRSSTKLRRKTHKTRSFKRKTTRKRRKTRY